MNESIAALRELEQQKAALDVQIKTAREAAKAELAKIDETRVKLAEKIHAAIKKLGIDEDIANVLGTGFVYKLDTDEIKYKAVEISTTAKPRVGGSGGGKAGKTTSEWKFADGSNDAPSLNDVYEAFATAEDTAKMTALQAEVPDAGARRSREYQIKVAVKKQAITDGKLVAK